MLPKNVGTAIGLELRDSTQALNASNTKGVKAGMTFNVAVGESKRRAARLVWLAGMKSLGPPACC